MIAGTEEMLLGLYSYPDTYGPTWMNKTIFRHNKKPEDDLWVPGFGPNVMFADGHVEPTVCIAGLTDENFSIRVR